MQVFNFGSLNIDHVYRVNKIVVAGQTITSSAYSSYLGGKGFNQSVAIAKSGAEISHLGMIGKDGLGLKDYLRELGVGTEKILISEKSTGHAIIQVDETGENAIVLFPGANREICDSHIEEFSELLSPGDFVVLQNEINRIDELIEHAADRGAVIFFNPAPMDDGVLEYPLEKVDYLIINEGEGRALSGAGEAAAIVDSLCTRYSCRRVIVTLGENGVCFNSDNQGISRLGAYSVKTVDTTAAGDAFIGYLVGCKVQGLEFIEALDMAMRAAAITTAGIGAAEAIPTAAQVENFTAFL